MPCAAAFNCIYKGSGMARITKRAMAALLMAVALGAAAPAPTPGLTVERVVLLMRHGVRPPTKSQPMPEGVAVDPWPSWSVKPGYLTQRGAAAVKLVGTFDRAAWADLFHGSRGCPPNGSVAVYSDSDQRTIATGDAWIAGFAPDCGIVNDHKPLDVADPLFDPIEGGAVAFDPARADREVRERLGGGGVAKVELAQRTVLKRLDAIYCGPKPVAGCGVSGEPTRLIEPRSGKKPKMSGALDLGSTAGQILLLEYADGKPMNDVGWGRATKADIAAASALHAVEYDVVARAPYVAATASALLTPRILAAMEDAKGPALSVIVGHDGNVAALAGMLDLHWKVPGLAADDPSPGGALGFEVLRDAAGKRYVRAFYRAQSLDQIRGLTPLSPARPAMISRLPIKGCVSKAVPDACPLAEFRVLIERLSPSIKPG